MDSIDDLIGTPVNSLLPVVQQLKIAVLEQPLGSLSLATPEDRRVVVELREALVDLRSLIAARISGIDMLAKRTLADSKVRRLYHSENAAPIVFEPPSNVYRIADPEGFRKALGAMVAVGALTHEEVDEAIHPEVEWRTNQAKINALTRRGEAIQEIVERFRTVEEPDPMGGTVKWPAAR